MLVTPETQKTSLGSPFRLETESKQSLKAIAEKRKT